MKLLAQLSWRWMLPGVVGVAFKQPVLSLLLTFGLSHQLFRSLRTVDFWQPYLAEMKPSQVWIGRIGLVGVMAFGIWGGWSDPGFPVVASWAGLILALLLETFALGSLQPEHEKSL